MGLNWSPNFSSFHSKYQLDKWLISGCDADSASMQTVLKCCLARFSVNTLRGIYSLLQVRQHLNGSSQCVNAHPGHLFCKRRNRKLRTSDPLTFPFWHFCFKLWMHEVTLTDKHNTKGSCASELSSSKKQKKHTVSEKHQRKCTMTLQSLICRKINIGQMRSPLYTLLMLVT